MFRILAVLAAILVLSFRVEAEISEPVTIGVILPLTGEASSWGEAIKNGIELARTKLTEEEQLSVKVVYEDDARDANKSVTAFRRMLTGPKPVAIIGTTAQPGLAVAPLAELSRVPYVSIAVPSQIAKDRKFSTLFFPSPSAMAKILVDESLKRGYRRIARISSLHDGRLEMKKQFDFYNDRRMKLALDIDIAPNEKDFRTLIARIREIQCDAIYVNLLLGQVGVFARQVRELGVSAPLFTSEMFEDEREVELANGALEGQWFVNQVDPTKTFQEEFRAKFPDSKMFLAANGYDAFLTLIEGIRTSQVRSESLNAYIHKRLPITGSLGKYQLGNDNRFSISVAVKEVSRGNFRTIRSDLGPAAQ